MTELQDEIKQAYERGWSFTPLDGKVPKRRRWQKEKRATLEDTLDWAASGNVGLRTGTASGVVVIDLDEGADTEGLELPQTVSVVTGSGGRHLYYLCPTAAIGNSVSKLGQHIDVRADGGQVVFVGSIHPDTQQPYVWEAGLSPDEVEMAVLPASIIERLNNGAEATAATETQSEYASAALRDECARVASAEQGARNDTLYRAAFNLGQLVGSGELDRRTVTPRLADAARQCGLDSDSDCGPKGIAATIESGLNAGVSTPRDNRGRAADDVFVAVGAPDQAQAETSSFPAHLLDSIPGEIGRICKWINDTAIKPQPILTLGNVLAFWGAVVGRKVEAHRLRTNLYCMGIGDSGCGKNHSRTAILELVKAAGIGDMMGGRPASDTGLLTALAINPARFFQWDEAGHLLASMNARNASSHQKMIPATLTELFTTAGSMFYGKEYADQKQNPRYDINQPHACFYGTTVPERLMSALSPDEIRDGFIGRLLLFVSEDDDPLSRRAVDIDPPAETTEAIVHWQLRDDLPKPEGNIAQIAENIPLQVAIEPAALLLFDALRTRVRELRKTYRDGTGVDVLLARTWEHAMKVALTVASSESYNPSINEATAKWSIELVEFLVQNLSTLIRANVSANAFEAMVQRVQKIIVAAGAEGIKRSLLSRRLRSLKTRELDEVLAKLEESGEISKSKQKGKTGPAATVYTATRGN
ncbi:MAG: bifunctional DNA primase/polymerase [bacterium]|nr:bifunctional DNA primase/polymerase [bacterium]